MMRLHGYWRSGAAYRLRIALNLKGQSYEQVTHDLRRAEHRSDAFRHLQPQGLVPALETENEVLIQSPAIIEWLEERYPEPAFLPASPSERAVVRAMAAIVTCDIHPLNNLRVLTSLRQDVGADEDKVQSWIARWIAAGFDALETLISRHGRALAFGDQPTIADICLVPQVYSAERFNVDLSTYPCLVGAAKAARALAAFAAAAPEAQPDATHNHSVIRSEDRRPSRRAPLNTSTSARNSRIDAQLATKVTGVGLNGQALRIVRRHGAQDRNSGDTC